MLTLWTVRLTTFLLWTLVAASAMFWVLQQATASSMSSASSTNAVDASSAKPVTQPALQIALALGAKTAALPTAANVLAAQQARFQLLGVLAIGQDRAKGAALVSVDGKPAKPYWVGAAIEGDLEVTALAARRVSIGSKGVTAFTLELPIKN